MDTKKELTEELRSQYRDEIWTFMASRRTTDADVAHDEGVDYLDNWMESMGFDRGDEEVWDTLLKITDHAADHSIAAYYLHTDTEGMVKVSQVYYEEDEVHILLTQYVELILDFEDLLELIKESHYASQR